MTERSTAPAPQNSHRKPEVSQAESFMAYLERRASEEGENRSFEVAVTQLERILTAETAEQVWDADEYESTGGRDLTDVEQRIRGFSVHKGGEQYKSALGYYIMVDSSRLDTGAEFIWNTGSPLIIGKLRWLEAHDMLPIDCVIKGTPTPNGEVLKLRPVPKRATSAKAESK